MYNYLQNKIHLFTILILSTLFLYSINSDILWLSLLTIYLLIAQNIYYSLQNLRENLVFLFFQLTFFIFFLGRITIQYFFDFSISEFIDFNLKDSEIKHKVLALIFISLVIITITYRFTKKKTHTTSTNLEYSSVYIKNLKNLALYIMYIAGVVQIAMIVEKTLFVQNYSYIQYYTDYKSSFPIFIRRIGSLYEVVIFVFLATMPTKKECRLPLIIYFLIGIGSLGFGQRNSFVLNTMFIVFYMNLRKYYFFDSDTWFKKTYYVYLIFILPLLIAFLAFYSYYRSGEILNLSSIELPKLFFYAQGFSANLIAYGIEYENFIPEMKFYSFGPILSFIRDSILLKPDNMFGNFSEYTINSAMEGNSFSMMISYLKLRGAYLSGAGLGSSYIAELFVDFGYIGVAAGSVSYGYLMAKFGELIKKNIWLSSFAFISVVSIWYAPRAEFLGFLSVYLSLTNLTIMTVMHVLAKYR